MTSTTPTPPPNYRLLRDDERGDSPHPDAQAWQNESKQWCNRLRVGFPYDSVHITPYYAIPTTTPEEKPTDWLPKRDEPYQVSLDEGKTWSETKVASLDLTREAQKTKLFRRPQEPVTDLDGWIPWAGGNRSPVTSGTLVDVKYRDGQINLKRDLADGIWTHASDLPNCDIIAYRLHKPEAAPTVAEPADPYAPFKQALKDGKKVQHRLDKDDRWRDPQGDGSRYGWSLPTHCYRIIEPSVPEDPYKALKEARAAGKVIEHRYKTGNITWLECLNPAWDICYEYRIKPTPSSVMPNTPEIPSGYTELPDSEKKGQWIEGAKFLSFENTWRNYQNRIGIDSEFGCRANCGDRIIIPKPIWRLPSPPPNQSWHRTDGWTEEMLPDGWRPLLEGETIEMGEEGDEMDVGSGKWSYQRAVANRPAKATDYRWRTRRPLPQPAEQVVNVTAPTWHNPENVPADKVPEGWRFLTVEEAHARSGKRFPVTEFRMWYLDEFYADYTGTDTCVTSFTYIIPSTIPIPGSVVVEDRVSKFPLKCPDCGAEADTWRDSELRQQAERYLCDRWITFPGSGYTNHVCQKTKQSPEPTEQQPNQTNINNMNTSTTATNTTPAVELPLQGQHYATKYRQGKILAANSNGVVLEYGPKKDPQTEHFTLEQWKIALPVYIPSKRELRQQAKASRVNLTDADCRNIVATAAPTTRRSIFRAIRLRAFYLTTGMTAGTLFGKTIVTKAITVVPGVIEWFSNLM